MTITSRPCRNNRVNGLVHSKEPGYIDILIDCPVCQGMGRQYVFETHEELELWNKVQDLERRVRRLEEWNKI